RRALHLPRAAHQPLSQGLCRCIPPAQPDQLQNAHPMTDQHDPHTAALPTPGAGPAMRMLDVAAVVASMTNPRKTFNSVKLAALAESIKSSGGHQPVRVRPLPADRLAATFAARPQGEPLPTHVMVAGERRWRACELAGVVDILVMIRELSDTQVLEIQSVE